jgi:hypothetical protein
MLPFYTRVNGLISCLSVKLAQVRSSSLQILTTETVCWRGMPTL